jgi:hypothetical protein
MKKIVFITLMLAGLIGQAQEYTTLNYWKEDDYQNNKTDYYYCFYDDENNLDSIQQVQNTVLLVTYYYDSDTMIMRHHHVYDSDTQFEYNGDSVFIVMSGDTIGIHTINEEFQIVDGDTFVWEDGNCISETGNWSATFSEFINPWIFAQVYLKGPYFFWGLSNGSYNLHDEITFNSGNVYRMEVVQSVDEWPYRIALKKDGFVIKDFEVQYNVFVSNGPELPVEPYTVLSVNYFDIMGREINKPGKGLYIERKVTNKGIISTKHYIQ